MSSSPLTPIISAFDLTDVYQVLYQAPTTSLRVAFDAAVFNNYTGTNVEYSVRLTQGGVSTVLNEVITDKTIRAIDRKREREKRFILNKARDNAEEFATRVTQRLIDREVLEINSVQAVREVFVEQLKSLPNMEEFDIQMKVAPIRTLIQDPNILSLYLTGYVIEDLINNPAIEDIFGEDIDIYRAIDSIFKVLRPPQ